MWCVFTAREFVVVYIDGIPSIFVRLRDFCAIGIPKGMDVSDFEDMMCIYQTGAGYYCQSSQGRLIHVDVFMITMRQTETSAHHRFLQHRHNTQAHTHASQPYKYGPCVGTAYISPVTHTHSYLNLPQRHLARHSDQI